MIKYSDCIVDWRKDGLKMDGTFRKTLILYGGMHLNSDTDTLYVAISKGNMGQMSIEYTVPY